MEHLLHYTWKHRLFPLAMLKTPQGVSVEVIDPGLHNTDAGPDFFNAKVKIDNMVWVGNVEIHTRSSDWVRHGHHMDPAYNSVILHVVSQMDCNVYTQNGRQIPQLLLTCPEHVKTHYQTLCARDYYPPCHSVITSLSLVSIQSWLSRLLTERLNQKTERITRHLQICDNHWENTFFVTLARNFGFGLNGDTFEQWALMLPFDAMNKHRDNLFQIEALFFGTAGLLEEHALKPDQQDSYGLKLRNEFRYLQRKFSLHQVMDASLWRLLRLRPNNFPHVRIAQLAALFHYSDKLFSLTIEAENIANIKLLLDFSTSSYWENHYIFGHESPYRKKTLGDKTKELIIINTIVPMLYAYGTHKANAKLCSKAGEFLNELKAENNHIVNAWISTGLSIIRAGQSQALIQLKKAYCDQRKCLYCDFGHEFLRQGP